jgi:hypothetical protein
MEIYSGFQILALGRETERSKIEYKLHKWFEAPDWNCSETKYGMTVTYMPTGQEASVSFEKVKYPSGNDANTEVYYVHVDAPLMGLRANIEKMHKDFFWETLGKIQWKKQGIWFLDGKRIPISRRILRMK